MFFTKFPDITYANMTMKDLSIAIIVRPEIKNHKDLFFWYQLEEWETPESVAFDFYGATGYNYVVLLMNDIVDPFFDWPLSRSELVEYCISKYGVPTIVDGKYTSNGYFAVRYWLNEGIKYPNAPNCVLIDGITPCDGRAPVGSSAVSHFEHEEIENDKKRRIKILYPELVQNLKEELENVING